MKVALIFPNVKESRITFYSSTHQPAGLAYIAAVLERSGHDVRVFDMTAMGMGLHDIVVALQEFSPDVIGFTTNVAIAKQSCLTAVHVHKALPRASMIFGGPWASMNATFLIERGIADIVVVGEGEQTMLDACNVIETDGSLQHVKGLAWNQQGHGVTFSEPRPRVHDLNELPFPAWHLFPPSKKYMFFNRYFPFFPLLGTRGCAYDCIHCTKFVHGHKLRARSIDNIIEELKHLKDMHGAKEIIIIDDNFTMNREFCTGVLKRIIQERLDYKINFANGIRADTVTPSLVKLLKRAGTYSIALGVESGDDGILRAIGKATKRATILKAARLIKDAGIFLRTFFILGLPGDDEHTLSKTVDFAIQLDADYAHFFVANPFPGTKMHEMVQDRHPGASMRFSRFYNKMDEQGYKGFLPWRTLKAYHKQAYLRYYTRPLKLLSLVSKFRTIQDVRWMLNFVILLLGDVFKRQ